MDAIVVKGQGVASRNILEKCPDVYQAVLGPVHLATLNLWIDGDYGRWPWGLGCDQFNDLSRRVTCSIQGVAGWVIFVEHPAPPWHDGQEHPEKTMLEVVCQKWIADVAPGTIVDLRVDLEALG